MDTLRSWAIRFKRTPLFLVVSLSVFVTAGAFLLRGADFRAPIDEWLLLYSSLAAAFTNAVLFFSGQAEGAVEKE